MLEFFCAHQQQAAFLARENSRDNQRDDKRNSDADPHHLQAEMSREHARTRQNQQQQKFHSRAEIQPLNVNVIVAEHQHRAQKNRERHENSHGTHRLRVKRFSLLNAEKSRQELRKDEAEQNRDDRHSKR